MVKPVNGIRTFQVIKLMQVPIWARPGVRSSKSSLLAQRTRCKINDLKYSYYHFKTTYYSCINLRYSRAPADSILQATMTVSPNKQYLGIVVPTIPATTGPVKQHEKLQEQAG